MAEYESRLALVFDATTAGGLVEPLADLPVRDIARHDPRRRSARVAAARLAVRLHLALYLVMAGTVLGVWAAVDASGGPTYFWPVWPLLGGAVGFLGHAMVTRLCTAVRSG